jgi:hypothetical protein
MKTYTKTTVTTEPRLVISYDESPESPREWSNLGYFITVDRNYHSPDKNPHFESVVKEMGEIATSQEEHIKLITKTLNEEGEKVLAVYPVVKYEHSGVVYRLGTAHGFDYSNNGFYIVTEKSQKELGTAKKDFEKVIESELEVYNKYANGEVYGFTLYAENGDIEDSCYGFYDIEDIREHLPEEFKGEKLSEYVKW